jgi:hypothetical protein
MPVSAVRSLCAVLVAVTCATVHGATLSRQQADAFERKVDEVRGPRRAGSASRRTPLTQDEVNSWFTYRAQPHLPEGISSPQLTMVGAGKLTGQATLDLEAIGRRRASGSWMDPWTLLGGRLPLSVTGTLQTQDGKGRFALESATLGGLPVPKLVLQELVSLYSRSDEQPRGMSLDDAFALPADIRQIEIGRGQAVVVQ